MTDREIMRRLTEEYMAAASRPVHKEKIKLWKALNRCEMARPMITIDQLPWDELQCPELALHTVDPYWRGVEDTLRKSLYKWRHFPVDMVLDPFISIPKILHHTGYGLSSHATQLGAENSTAKSSHYENLIQSLEDVEKITDYHISHDEKATSLRLEEAKEWFGDIAPASAHGVTLHLGIWDYLSMLMGVEAAFFAFVDQPALMHAAMERMTQATLCAIEDADAGSFHDDNANLCHCSHIYTDELLPDSGQGRGPKTKNCWAFGLAQLFTSLSPDMFEEFELPYISRMAEKFGMIYYGCCDRLDDRLDIVKKIPNVRKVSCSPWSDRKAFAEKIGPDIVMSVKPSPAFLSGDAFDPRAVECDIRNACELAKQNNVNVEFLLKDVSTVRNEPSRLTQWADTALRIMESY